MEFKRESGILLHPTSLPSKYGIGDLGQDAYDFIDFLKRSGQKLWQILPLNPTGYDGSPYQALSAFAGNPLLISPDGLYKEGLLNKEEIATPPSFDACKVDFTAVEKYKTSLLKKAFDRFKTGNKDKYIRFVEDNRIWLEDFSFFMAVKNYFNGLPWNRWNRELILRKKSALQKYKEILSDEIEFHKFIQYIFFVQWNKLKNYANEYGIKIIGDIPIYISFDSSDVWSNPELFQLDADCNPVKVAGVPPDYFSKTGQLWGNPLYRWNKMKKDDYKWWRERFQNTFKYVDIVRIDHFRGFEAYWAIPAGEDTAVNGKWVKGPGEKFFSVIQEYIGDLPVIAEDLGVITPEVEKLKNMFEFPGMKILQFDFENGLKKGYSPFYSEKNSVVYTGTHDNDTTLGWYKKNIKVSNTACKYLSLVSKLDDSDIVWYFIDIALKSQANTAIIPLQDVLCLDSDARMNVPGTAEGNWRWRFQKKQLGREIEDKLGYLTSIYKR